MIEIISTKSEFDKWNKKDIYSVRILALLDAYGCKYPFVLFYKQVIDGQVVSIISKLDDDFTLSTSENSDFDELEQFFKSVGFLSILCSPNFNMNCHFEQGKIMKSVKKYEFSKTGATIDTYPKLMNLFNLIDHDKLDFESWYVDLSHRIRHGAAKAVTVNFGDEIISSGVFTSIYKKYAILSAVNTVAEFRKLGYGSFLVSSMVSDFNGTVYLMREQNKNESFYKKIGFENIGDWRIYKK